MMKMTKNLIKDQMNLLLDYERLSSLSSLRLRTIIFHVS